MLSNTPKAALGPRHGRPIDLPILHMAPRQSGPGHGFEPPEIHGPTRCHIVNTKALLRPI